MRIGENGLEAFMGWTELNQRSQDLQPAYIADGALFIISPSLLRQKRCLIDRNTQIYLIRNELESLDIDTFEDWQIAEKNMPFNFEK